MDMVGEKILCIKMKGVNSVKSGEIGIIQYVDGLYNIHVKWNNGSTLSLIPHLDEFEILTLKKERELKLKKLKKNEN